MRRISEEPPDTGTRIPDPARGSPLLLTSVSIVGADCPARRRRSAGHVDQEVVLRAAGVGRIDKGARIAIPMVNDRLISLPIIVGANRPAVRRRRARHTNKALAVSVVASVR